MGGCIKGQASADLPLLTLASLRLKDVCQEVFAQFDAIGWLIVIRINDGWGGKE